MKERKRVVSDFIFGVIGLVGMNAVLSLIVNPTLEKQVGTAFFGRVLFFSALATFLASSLGAGVNYARMKVFAEERETKNGDSNIALLIVSFVAAAVTVLAILLKKDAAGVTWAELILLTLMTVLRYYADVEYRLNLNYKRFCLFYLLIGAGYLLGLLLYQVIGSWTMIFLTGELFGLLFVFLTGKVLKPPYFDTSPRLRSHLLTAGTVSGSYVLSDFVSAADRFLFPLILVNGDELTALYYFASVVGKMMSLLSTPLNGVLSGHIARAEGGMTRKRFLRIVLLLLGVAVAVTGVSFLGSHLFVRLFYRDSYETVRGLFLLANAGQVIFFVTNTLMVIVLRYMHERIQIITGILYLAAFFAVTVPLIRAHGIWGMAWGLFIVNTLKFLLFAFLGAAGIKEEKNGQGNSETE